jgi:glycosyltransferase involved in cell wall biosynthesis
LKIGILSYRSHPYSGGQGIYVRHLSKAFQRLGHEVTVLSGPPYPQLDASIKLEKISSLELFEAQDRMKEFKLNFLFSPIDLYEWITVMTGGFPEPYTFGKRVLKHLRASKQEFDIILDNQSLCYSLMDIQKLYPLAVTIHHPITKDYKLEMENASNWKERLSSRRWHNFLPMQKKVAPKLRKIICVSRPSKQDTVEEFLVNPRNVDVILNGIDIETFKPNSNIKVIENRIVTTASADIPLKGLRFLIQALTTVLKDFPETSLIVIGKSSNGSKIRKLVDNLSLNEKISFKSNLSEEEIVDIYHTSQIAVIPSLYEGFGFGAGEAMSCGTPLISTDSGGLKDVIGDSAMRIKSGSVEDIEKGIINLFNSPERRQKLSLRGRRRMEDLFDWKISASNYIKVFEDTINTHKSANN